MSPCKGGSSSAKRSVMASRDAGRFGQATSTASDEETSATIKLPPWYRRVAFWRAVAGMALTIALGCLIITSEFSTELLERTRHLHHRLSQLSSTVATMRGEIASADREIAGMRDAVEIDDDLRRILAEPDARLIRLSSPDRDLHAVGVIAFSHALRNAAIELAGLPAPTTGRVFNLWWMRGTHDLVMGGSVHLGAAGKAAFTIILPADDQVIAGAIVTADARAAAMQPSGAIILKGTVSRPSALKGRSKR
jgi:hypothetical protein